MNKALILFFLALQANAFDKQTIIFENPTNTTKKVVFEFVGQKFEQPLDILSNTDIQQPDVKKIYDFFKKFYDVNKNGNKQDILKLWEANDGLFRASVHPVLKVLHPAFTVDWPL